MIQAPSAKRRDVPIRPLADPSRGKIAARRGRRRSRGPRRDPGPARIRVAETLVNGPDPSPRAGGGVGPKPILDRAPLNRRKASDRRRRGVAGNSPGSRETGRRRPLIIGTARDLGLSLDRRDQKRRRRERDQPPKANGYHGANSPGAWAPRNRPRIPYTILADFLPDGRSRRGSTRRGGARGLWGGRRLGHPGRRPDRRSWPRGQ